MKKILLIISIILISITGGYAQNANRNGFFIELGAGFPIGSIPAYKVGFDNNAVAVFYPGGPDVNFAIGYRRTMGKSFAWEIKGEGSAMPTKFRNTMVIALLPGIRYTSKELFGNTSLFCGINIGVLLSRGGYGSYYLYESPDYPDYRYDWYDDLNNGDIAIGVKFGADIGLNITSSFYTGLYLDCNVIDAQDVVKDNTIIRDWNLWGSLGLRLGYRF